MNTLIRSRPGFQMRPKPLHVPASPSVRPVLAALLLAVAGISAYLFFNQREREPAPTIVETCSTGEAAHQAALETPGLETPLHETTAFSEPFIEERAGHEPPVTSVEPLVATGMPAQVINDKPIEVADDPISPGLNDVSEEDDGEECRASEFAKRYREILDLRKETGARHPESVEQLRQFREDLVTFISSDAGRDTNAGLWREPFERTHSHALRHECRNYAEAERLTRRALDALRAVDSATAWRIAVSVFTDFGFEWVYHDPENTAALLDELEQAVLTQQDDRAVKEFWYFRTGYLHVNCFINQHRVAESRRADFARERAEKITACFENEDISLRRRTRILAYWSYYGLFQLGHRRQATNTLRDWWKQHGAKIREASFYHNWMVVELSGNGDWERADHILKAAVSHTVRNSSYCEATYKAMMSIYYDNVLLPGYDLQRRHWLKEQRVLKSLAAAAVK